jgi:hypothetical protein
MGRGVGVSLGAGVADGRISVAFAMRQAWRRPLRAQLEDLIYIFADGVTRTGLFCIITEIKRNSKEMGQM